MDLKTTYTKTGKGMRATINKLPPNAGKVLSVIDKTITGEEAFYKIKKINEEAFETAISWLLDGNYIKVVATEEFPQSIWAPPSKDAFKISEISFDQFDQNTKNPTKSVVTDAANLETEVHQHTKAQAKREQVEKKQAAASALDYYKKAKERKKKEEKAKKASLEVEAKQIENENEAAERKKKENKKKADEEKVAKIKSHGETKAKAEKDARIKAEAEAQEIEKTKTAAHKLKAQETKLKAKAEKEATKLKAKAEKDTRIKAEAEALGIKKAEAVAHKLKTQETKQKENAEKEAIKRQEKTEKEAAKLKAKAEKEERIHASANLKGTKKSNIKWSSYFFKGIRYLLISSVSVIILLLIAAQFLNLHFLIMPIEKATSEILQDHVNIQAIHASIIPRPHLILDGFAIGESSSIKGQKIRIYPNLSALKDKISTISKTPYDVSAIEVDDLTISQDSLSKIKILAKNAKNNKLLNTKRILLKKVTIMLNGIGPLIIDSDVFLNKNNEFNNAVITSEGKHLVISVIASREDYLLIIKGENWRLPISPNPIFTQLNAKGNIKNNILTLSSIEGDLYNGGFKANLTSDLSKSWTTQGDFDLARIQLVNMAKDIKYDGVVEGKLETTGSFSFNINKDSNQIDVLNVKAKFKVNNGMVKKVDLIEAMRSGRTNGVTSFTSLSGNALLNNERYQFNNILLQDNQLQARGSLSISKSKTLTGNVSSQISVRQNAMKSRFRITGTTERVNLVN